MYLVLDSANWQRAQQTKLEMKAAGLIPITLVPLRHVDYSPQERFNQGESIDFIHSFANNFLFSHQRSLQPVAETRPTADTSRNRRHIPLG